MSNNHDNLFKSPRPNFSMAETLESKPVKKSKLVTLLRQNGFQIESGIDFPVGEEDLAGVFLIKIDKVNTSPYTTLGGVYLGNFTARGKEKEDRNIEDIRLIAGPYYDVPYLEMSTKLKNLLTEEKIPFTDGRNTELIKNDARDYAAKLLRAALDLT